MCARMDGRKHRHHYDGAPRAPKTRKQPLYKARFSFGFTTCAGCFPRAAPPRAPRRDQLAYKNGPSASPLPSDPAHAVA